MDVSFQRGTMGELVSLIEQAARENPGIPAFTAALAMAYAEGDRIDEAVPLLDDLAAADFDLPPELNWLSGMVAYAEAAIECRDPNYAAPFLERLAPWADQFACTDVTTEGPASHYLGALATVLGRYDEANAYFAQSAEFSKRVGATFFAARTNLSWGKMLVERRAPNDAERARDLLTDARRAATTHGYANVERRAAEGLQHLA